MFTGRSAEVKVEVFRRTIYPPGCGLAAVNVAFTTEPVTEVPKPVTLAVGVILTETLVCVPPLGVAQTFILGPAVEEIVPLLVIELAQSVLQELELEVMVPPLGLFMVPEKVSEPLKLVVPPPW